jgi:hypothetical protein
MVAIPIPCCASHNNWTTKFNPSKKGEEPCLQLKSW